MCVLFFLSSYQKMFILFKGCAGIKKEPKAVHDATLGKYILSISCAFNI